MPSSETLTGREYLRVSRDKSGKGRSPEQQHADNVRACPDFGVTLVGEPYRDDDRSASKHARKIREDFERLIDDLENERFGAKVLVLWEGSRGSRKASEWVYMADLMDAQGLYVFVTTNERLYNMRKPRDRKDLLQEALDSEYEAALTRSRIKRDTASQASAGRPHGQVRYGYQRFYDEHTGYWREDQPHPDEAPNVRELFRRLKKGEALAHIGADWRKRDIHTRPRWNKKTEQWETRLFSSQHLRSLALNPAYAGIRVHDPERKGSGTYSAQAVEYPAVWPGLVTKEDFLAVKRILTAPERRKAKDGRAKHLVSNIAACMVCGGGLNVTTSKGKLKYRCGKKFCVQIEKEWLEKFATDLILGYLAREDNYSALILSDNTAELQKVMDDLAKARSEHDDLAKADISVALAAKKEPAILKHIAELEAEERRLRTPSQLAGLITPGADVATRWHDDELTPITSKRAIARLLFAPDYLGALFVRQAKITDGRAVGGRWASALPLENRVALGRVNGGLVTVDSLGLDF